MAASSTAHLYSQGEGEFSCSNTTSGQEWILDAYRALEPRNYLHEFTSQNVRPDGRPYSASRPITILQSIFTRNSYGSAMVTLGGASSSSSNTSSGSTIRTMEATRVIAACTILVGQPNPATPTEGDIDVTLTASPLSGPRFDIMGRETAGDSSTSISLGNYHLAGQQQQQQQQPPYSQISENLCSDILKNSHLQQPYQQQPSSSPTDVKEIESWIRRTLRSSRFINPTELGIEPGVSAWRIRVSIHIVNHEGNVWDASLLAACAALSDLRIPMVEIERGVVRIVKNENGDGTSSNDLQHSGKKKKKKKVQRREGRSLTLGPPPVPLTIAILPNSNTDDSPSNNTRILLVDPTHLEEDVASGNIVTVVCNTKEEIVEFHKKGSGSRLSMEQVAAVGCMGFGRARELEKFIIGG